MTDRMADILFYGLILLLPLSALIARRPPAGPTARMALAWAGIFALGLLLVSQLHRLPSFDQLLNGQQVGGWETRIGIGDDGHFRATAVINGVRRRMLIDSGATFTALSVGTAQAVGLDMDQNPFPVMLETANGRITARRVALKRLTVGSINADDLTAVVSPAFGDEDVIGMNFLSRLRSWRVEGRTLVLTPN